MKKINENVNLILLSIIYIFSSCIQQHTFSLRHVTMPDKAVIDTLEQIKERNILLVRITQYKALGKMNSCLAVLKQLPHKQLIYEIEDGKFEALISRDYVALVKPFEIANSGWFAVENSKIVPKLPRADELSDSIRKSTAGSFFVREAYGDFTLMQNGIAIRKFNYGNLITKYKHLDFDSLPQGIYRWHQDSLLFVSDNADVLFKQKEGVYFIPFPGYGVVQQIEKEKILQAVENAAKQQTHPASLTLQATRVE